jgi:hypothetical protein
MLKVPAVADGKTVDLLCTSDDWWATLTVTPSKPLSKWRDLSIEVAGFKLTASRFGTAVANHGEQLGVDSTTLEANPGHEVDSDFSPAEPVSVSARGAILHWEGV